MTEWSNVCFSSKVKTNEFFPLYLLFLKSKSSPEGDSGLLKQAHVVLGEIIISHRPLKKYREVNKKATENNNENVDYCVTHKKYYFRPKGYSCFHT